MPPAHDRDLDGEDPGSTDPEAGGCPEDLDQTRTELERANRKLEMDLEDRLRGERELRLLHDLAEEISFAPNLKTALEAVLKRICEGGGFSFGEAWLPDTGGKALVLEAYVSGTDPPEGWAEATQSLRLARGEGLPGEAWETDDVVWAEDISEDGTLPRAQPARHAGLRAGVAIPISSHDEVEAVLMFVVDEPRPRDRRFVRLVSTIAHNLASWIHHRNLQDELQDRTLDLEASNRELTRIADAAAHDLQEPLRDVVRYVQRIDERLADRLDDEGREDLRYAVDGAKRLHDQLNDLLRYTEAGDRTEVEHRADGRAVLEEVLEKLSPQIDATHADVSYEELPPLPLAKQDLVVILEELIENALLYNDAEPPRIKVWARHSADAWLVTVEDNGVGIEPAYQGKVFELFERLDRDGPPGAGLGLALCRRIAERYGGHILLASEPGEGTTVTVRLPDDV